MYDEKECRIIDAASCIRAGVCSRIMNSFML